MTRDARNWEKDERKRKGREKEKEKKNILSMGRDSRNDTFFFPSGCLNKISYCCRTKSFLTKGTMTISIGRTKMIASRRMAVLTTAPGERRKGKARSRYKEFKSVWFCFKWPFLVSFLCIYRRKRRKVERWTARAQVLLSVAGLVRSAWWRQ